MEETEKIAQEIADSLEGVINDGYLDTAVYGSAKIEISKEEYEKMQRILRNYFAAQKKYREKNKEYYKEYHRKWQRENKERVSQYQKEWRRRKKLVDILNGDDIVSGKEEVI